MDGFELTSTLNGLSIDSDSEEAEIIPRRVQDNLQLERPGKILTLHSSMSLIDNLVSERITDCIGRPQMAPPGKIWADLWKRKDHRILIQQMELRMGRINAIKYGMPVAKAEEYTDEMLNQHFLDVYEDMKMSSEDTKVLFEIFKKKRVAEIQKWMMEEDELIAELSVMWKDMRSEFPDRSAKFNWKIPMKEFLAEDYSKVEYLLMESAFAIEDAHDVSEKLKFQANLSCVEMLTAVTDPNYRQLMVNVIEDYPFGMTVSAFWDSFVEKAKLASKGQLKLILGDDSELGFCKKSPELFYYPLTNNPLNLLFASVYVGLMDEPKAILEKIWHRLSGILLQRYRNGGGHMPLDEICQQLKYIATYDIHLAKWGFRNVKEMCIFFSKEFPTEKMGVFDIVVDDVDIDPPVLAHLTKENCEKFEKHKKQIISICERDKKRQAAFVAGMGNRIVRQGYMEGISKYVAGPEPIVKIPLSRGMKLKCLLDHFDPDYPFFLVVYPSALENTVEELQCLIRDYYCGKEGDAATISTNKLDQLEKGTPVVVYTCGDNWLYRKAYAYHRATYLGTRDQKIYVELYDRGVGATVTLDCVRLMTQEIFHFAPAMGIRVREHIQPEKYPRAVETRFRKHFRLTCEEVEELVVSYLKEEVLIVNLMEKLNVSTFNDYWSVKLLHSIFDGRSHLAGRRGPPKVFVPYSRIIAENVELSKRFEEGYNDYLTFCATQSKGYDEVPQNWTTVVGRSEENNMTKMTEDDYFRLVDPLYALPEEAVNKKQGKIAESIASTVETDEDLEEVD